MNDRKASDREPYGGPRVSVLIPVYNTAPYLEQALNSVLCQTLRDFELIIVDDGSTDGSEKLLEAYEQDPRVIVERNEHRGNISARNACLALARADLIAWLDSDDVAHRDWLSRQLAYMETHPDCVAVGSQSMLIEEHGWPVGPMPRPLEHDEIDRINLDAEGGGISHSAVLMRRRAVERIGGYDESMNTVEDMHLLLRMAETGRLANLPDLLLWRRLRAKSVSHAENPTQSRMRRRTANLARRRRGLPSLPEAAPENPTTTELLKTWMWHAHACDYQLTAIRLAGRILRAHPLCRPAALMPLRAMLRILRGRLRVAGHAPRVRRPLPGGATIEAPRRDEAWYVEPQTRPDHSLRPILLYNPSNRGLEREFWPRLRMSLRSRGFELFSAGCEDGRSDIPHLYLPHGLDALRPDATLGFRWACRWPLQEQEALERETLFTGKAGCVAERMQACHQIATLQAAILAQLEPRLVIFWNGEQPQQLILRQLLRETGCPTTRVERSPFPGILYEDNRGLMARASFCSQRILWTDDVEREAWRARLEAYAASLIASGATWWGETRPRNRSLRGGLHVPAGSTVALFAAQVDCDTQNFFFSPHFSTNLQAFETFCRLAREVGDVFVIGKHHPMSDTPPETYRRIVGDLGVWLTDVSIEDCLEAADVVAAVNSSVLFEAGLRGKRCLALGQTMLHGREVFYEMSGADDAETFRAWLDGRRAGERRRRWEEAVSWLFAHHLYAEAQGEELGLNDHEALADRLVARAGTATPDYSALRRASWSVLHMFHALGQVAEGRLRVPIRRGARSSVV